MEYAELSNKLYLVIIPFSFILVVGGVLIHALYVRNVLNKRLLEKEHFKKLEAEKKLIANEIHDSVGAFIVSVRSIIDSSECTDLTEGKQSLESKLTQFQDSIISINNQLYPT